MAGIAGGDSSGGCSRMCGRVEEVKTQEIEMVADLAPEWAKELKRDIEAVLISELRSHREDVTNLLFKELRSCFSSQSFKRDERATDDDAAPDSTVVAQGESYTVLLSSQSSAEGASAVSQTPTSQSNCQTPLSQTSNAVFADGADDDRQPTRVSSSSKAGQKAEYSTKMHSEMNARLSDAGLPFPLNLVPNSWWRTWSCFRSWVDTKRLPDNALARAVESHVFHTFYFFVICANAVWIGCQSHEQLHDQGFDDTTMAKILTFGFIGAFAIEMILKVCGLGWYYWVGDSWRWNVFDATLLVVSIPELFLDHINLTFGRVLKMIRVVRVFRLFRIVHAFRELRQIVVSIMKTWGTLFWAAVMFALVIYIFAIFIMQSASIYISSASTPEEHGIAQELLSMYGTIGDSMLGLFWILTGGDWAVAVKPLIKVNRFFEILFAAFMFFMTFGMLNVIIGMFCEKASGAILTDRSLRIADEADNADAFIAEMRSIFFEMDKEGTGEVGWEPFMKYISNDETGNFLRSHGIPTHDAHQLFEILDEIDDDPSGTMDLASFVLGMQRLSGHASGTDLNLLIVESRKRARKMQTSVSHIKQQLDRNMTAISTTLAAIQQNSKRSPC